MTLERLRERAAGHTLFAPLALGAAVSRLGFVQADPIRAPARAQDLILHQRVAGYVAGDLERRYAALRIEEDYLYAYGFMPRAVRRLLHPRLTRPLTKLENAVLAVLQERGPVHPATLEDHFGRTRAVNAWGGYSKASTRALDWLHYAGRIRVARREGGVRVYAASPTAEAEIPMRERFERIVLIVADILAPVPERTLAKLTARMRRHFGARADHRAAIDALVTSGVLRRDVVDGRTYLRPPGRRAAPPQERVRLLAPFDPVVWDRERFEHLWGWAYRFEAYTPAAERVRGYYALPLLWRSAVIGWANVALAGSGLSVELGFAGARPAERAFAVALEEEIERMRSFLNANAGAAEF